jgi:hypothetical protein
MDGTGQYFHVKFCKKHYRGPVSDEKEEKGKGQEKYGYGGVSELESIINTLYIIPYSFRWLILF